MANYNYHSRFYTVYQEITIRPEQEAPQPPSLADSEYEDWDQISDDVGAETRRNSRVAAWSMTVTQSPVHDPNFIAPSETSSANRMAIREDPHGLDRHTPTGNRNKQLRHRYQQLELERDYAQLDIDRLDLLHDSNPQDWNNETASKYREAQTKKDEAQAAMKAIGQSLYRPSEQIPAQHQQLHSDSAPPILQTQGRRQSSFHAERANQNRGPREHTPNRNQTRRYTDPYAILRPYEVPYISAYERINSAMIGSATGRYRHSDSSVNGVGAGGYPVPELSRMWHNPESQTNSRTATMGNYPTRNRAVAPPTTAPPSYNALAEWTAALDSYKRGQYDTSLAKFRGIVDRPETTTTVVVPHARLYYNIGIILSIKENLPAAIVAFEQATNEDQSLIIAHYCLGVCHYKLRDAVRAMQSFEAALSRFEASYQSLNYAPMGLNLMIQKTQIKFARDLCVRSIGGYQDLPMVQMDVLFEPVGGASGGSGGVGSAAVGVVKGGGGGGGDDDDDGGDKRDEDEERKKKKSKSLWGKVKKSFTRK